MALFETIYHHGRFMARTAEDPGWTSQFREIVLDVGGRFHDLRHANSDYAPIFLSDDYAESQVLGAGLRAAKSEGVAYPSQRLPGGECVGLFYPDMAANPRQGRHFDYHWDGRRVDLYRDMGSGQVFRII